MTTIEIITYILAALGTVATLANAASLLVPKDSTAGRWLAWVASMPITHAPGKVKPPPVGPAIALVFALQFLNGCAGTLEESRGAIRVTNIAGLTRDDKRCAALSDRNTGFKVSAVTFGALAPVLLVGSGQVKSDRWQTGLQIASGTSGALAGGAAIGQSYTAASYIEEGCAK